MGDADGRLPDLEVLSGKVYQAKELISRLRHANRELTTRLEEIQSRLETQEDVEPVQRRATRARAAASEPEVTDELERLRRERREIRERVSRLLQHMDDLEL